MRVAPKIVLTDDQRSQLLKAANGRSVSVRLAERASIVLRAADGRQDIEIAEELSVTRQTVARWRRRWLTGGGFDALLKDRPRGGRRRGVRTERKVRSIVQRTTQTTPADATHWSCRAMARAERVSEATVRRVWREHGLKPHLVESFKLSNDKHFAERLDDVVGLYLCPPDRAIVLSCDEKSQIQALDRTQPGLPLGKGHAAAMTHDYKRHGTTTLFAALSTLDGRVISTCMRRHRHQEWIKFLRLIDASTPPDKELHLIVDNYATHKHARVQAWLRRHARFHIHFTPTSSSWLNMVERFFRDLTVKRLRRGTFKSVPELVAAIESYVAQQNANPKPFIWTAKASDILQKVTRLREKLHKLTSD
jgi:transposase